MGCKYVVMTGGTMSGLGKGTSMSSLGVLLKANNISLTCIKIDPYLNVDAGTMSPYEHGEVYVLNDGGEVDLDLGNYERFLNLTLSRDHNITTGKIFENVISKERRGEYLGKTVQIVPMVTNLIQEWITNVSQKAVDRKVRKTPQVCLVEVGGTVGDIESAVYLEALQQLKRRVGPDNFCLCHLSYVPTIGSNSEQKTKPTQHSVKTLREAGLAPDIIFCRCTEPLTDYSRNKIAMFSQLTPDCVVSVTNCENLYKVPLILDQQNVAQLVCDKLKIEIKHSNPPSDFSLDTWKKLSDRSEAANGIVKVGIVGKYTGLIDSYLSVMNALKHSAMEANLKLEVVWIDSAELEVETSSAWDLIKSVEGGFGDRGINGKCLAARYCRHNKIPYFGICMGLQTAVIDLYREYVNPKATSQEFITESATNNENESQNNNTNLAIISMPEFDGDIKGGTMRLGKRITVIDKNSLVYALYDKQERINERHRHRYEVNPKIVPKLESLGLKFVGTMVCYLGKDETGSRMEICELNDHPFFLCVQFHPEFNSLPLAPSPCFLAFILSCKGILNERLSYGGGCLNSDKVEPLDPVVKDQYKQFKLDVTLQAIDSFRQGIPKKILYFNNLLKLNHTVGRLFFANDLDRDSFKPTFGDSSKRGREAEVVVPSHRQIVEELERIKDEASELIEMVGNIKLWIQLNIPRIEDGNNFGVGIQEEVIQELARVEDSAFNLFDAIVKYYMARGKLSTKLIKYPNVLDYQEAIRELDEKEWIHTKIAKVDMRNNYSMVYELLSKNWEKVVKPKSEDAHSHMTF